MKTKILAIAVIVCTFLLYNSSYSLTTIVCQKGNGYTENVKGNIDHYQSTGCTPHLQPFDCTIEVEYVGPPAPGCSIGLGKVIFDNQTETTIGTDLYSVSPLTPHPTGLCSDGTIKRIVFTKTGRELTASDKQRANLCP